VLAAATLFGFWKGMAWQLASLASLVVSYFAALRFSPVLAPMFGSQEPFNRFVAMLVVYLVVSLVIWLAFRVVGDAIDRLRLQEFDRQVVAEMGLYDDPELQRYVDELGQRLARQSERPDLPWCQRIRYMEEMPSMQAWRRMHAAGELDPVQAAWFAELKPGEELYDLEEDPHEIRNLAADREHQMILREHRRACDEWRNAVGDLGLLTERELIERGIVANRLDGEYFDRIDRLPDGLQPAGGPWDCLGRPWSPG